MIKEIANGTIYDDKEINAISRLIKSTKSLNRGEEIKVFEKNFSKYLEKKYAIAVSSCTAALKISFQVLNLKKNDEIIISANTFWNTICSLIDLGIKLVVVDTKKDSLNIDENLIEERINSKTKAICFWDYGGISANSIKINKIAKKYGILTIQDCAHSIGGSYYNKKAGFYSDFSCFSFSTLKNMGTLGEGGMIVTNNKVFYKKCQMLRESYPIGDFNEAVPKIKYKFLNLKDYLRPGNSLLKYSYKKLYSVGSNFKMSSVQATVGNIQLKKLPKLIRLRKRIHMVYMEMVNKNEIFTNLYLEKKMQPSYHYFSFLYKSKNPQKGLRDKLLLFLDKKNNIKLINRYWPIYENAVVRKHIKGQVNFQNFHNVWFNELVCLPISPNMKVTDARKIVSKISEFIQKNEN